MKLLLRRVFHAEYTADSYVRRVIRTIHDVHHMSSNAEECVSVSRTPIRADTAAASVSVRWASWSTSEALVMPSGYCLQTLLAGVEASIYRPGQHAALQQD